MSSFQCLFAIFLVAVVSGEGTSVNVKDGTPTPKEPVTPPPPLPPDTTAGSQPKGVSSSHKIITLKRMFVVATPYPITDHEPKKRSASPASSETEEIVDSSQKTSDDKTDPQSEFQCS